MGQPTQSNANLVTLIAMVAFSTLNLVASTSSTYTMVRTVVKVTIYDQIKHFKPTTINGFMSTEGIQEYKKGSSRHIRLCEGTGAVASLHGSKS